MAKVSILAILGHSGNEQNEEKFQKLLCDGMVIALGNLAPEVDAALATASSPSPSPQKTEEYGTSVTQTLSSGCHVRVLLHPRIAQFQAAFNDAVHIAVQAGPGSTIAVVYAGQVLHSTGEWILADSTFSGSQLKMWVDCEATVSWQPEIPKLMAPPSGVPPFHLCVCTPSAGARTCWPTTIKQAAGDGSQCSTYVMLSKSRKITVQLQVKASWRMDGKLVSLPQTGSAFEGLNALSKEMAALQWNQQEATRLNYEELTLLQKTFKPSPPALYLMPSGPGGVQCQAAGIFVIEGTNILMGSAFAHGHPPQWWDLAKNLDRLDAVVLPDWSAASIQSYNFLTQFASTVSASTGYAWIGSIMVPPTESASSESILVMSPSSSGAFGDRQFTLPAGPSITSADRLPDRLRIFSKLGLGELYLQPLGGHVGTLVVWKPTKAAPIRLFLPSTAGVLNPVQSLSQVLKALRGVPEVCLETKTAPSVSGGGSTSKSTVSAPHNSAPTKTAARPLTANRPFSGLNHTPPRNPPASARTRPATAAATTTPGKTVGTAKRSPTSAATPLAAATTKKPATQVKSAPPPAAAARTVAKAAPTTKATPTPAPAKPTSRPSNGHARPSATAATAAKASPRSTSDKTSSVGAGTKKTPIVPKTQARLNAHAAQVQAKSKAATPAPTAGVPAATTTTTTKIRSSPPDMVLKFAADGRPTNLPPRRKVGEKTVMEELAEIPTTESKSSAAESPLVSPHSEVQQAKSPEASSPTEATSAVRQQPDSLLSPADESATEVESPLAQAKLIGEPEPQTGAVQKQQEEAQDLPEAAHLGKELDETEEPKHTIHPEDTLAHEEEHLESHETHPDFTKADESAIHEDLTGGYHEPEEPHPMTQTPEALDDSELLFRGTGEPALLPHETTFVSEAAHEPSSTYPTEGDDLDQDHSQYHQHDDVDTFGQVKAEAESSQCADEEKQCSQQQHTNVGTFDSSKNEAHLLDPSMPSLHMENQFPVHSGLTDLQEDCREHQQGEEYSSAMSGVTSTTAGVEFPYPSDPNALMPDGQQHHPSCLEDSSPAPLVADGQYMADSTTGTTAVTPDRPFVGLSPLGQEHKHFASEEHPDGLSPASESSRDSVVHHEPINLGPPGAYGFKLDIVTSSSSQAAAAAGVLPEGDTLSDPDLSPNAAAPHPLAYRPHDLPTTTAGASREFAAAGGLSPASYNSDVSSPAGHPMQHCGVAGQPEAVLYETQRSNGYSHHHEGDSNGHLRSTTDAVAAAGAAEPLKHFEDSSPLLQAKKTPSSEAVHEGEQVFDPLQSWGNPQGMPAPNPPSTRLSTPRTRTSTTPSKTGHSTVTGTPHAPETLPPGPPVYLDVVWVPGYIVRAPFDIAVTFFTQVRSRCYILSGASLHPLVGEALIAGISKWTAEEKARVGSMGHDGLKGINVIPTDEPLDWVRWLRTNCGSTTVNETGEQRLQAAGLQVHPSATLCDIHFSDKGTEVTCQGTQISI